VTAVRRADAERSIAAILDAALGVLAARPEAGMGEIAAAAGVSRQTVYAHFPSREALLDAVAQRALAESLAAIDVARPGSGPPPEALDRLIGAWWSAVARNARVLQALAGAPGAAGDARDLHAPIVDRLERLVARGQRSGDFDRASTPAWLAAAFLGLVHAAADEVAAGRMDEDAAARALRAAIPRVMGL
jgi:AcrR family transcriptional regulator